MLRRAVLSFVMPCCAALCRAEIRRAVLSLDVRPSLLCYSAPCSAEAALHRAVLCGAASRRAVLRRAVLSFVGPCCAAPCRFELRRALLCCAVLC